MDQGLQLSEEVTRRLLEEIRYGRYQDMKKLPPEVELAGQLGVSRTLLRDCLAILEPGGIYQPQARRWHGDQQTRAGRRDQDGPGKRVSGHGKGRGLSGGDRQREGGDRRLRPGDGGQAEAGPRGTHLPGGQADHGGQKARDLLRGPHRPAARENRRLRHGGAEKADFLVFGASIAWRRFTWI